MTLGDLAATFKDYLANLNLRSYDYVMICFPSKKQNVNKTLVVVLLISATKSRDLFCSLLKEKFPNPLALEGLLGSWHPEG